MHDFSLNVEDEPVTRDVSAAGIASVLQRMTPRGGPSFLVLEASNGDYVQAAGGLGRFTVEWREVYGEGFCHWKAGATTVSRVGEAKVKTNGFHVAVRRYEVLSAAQAAQILSAFLRGATRPASFAWRDMTSDFACDQ